MRSKQHRSNPLACHKRVTIITSREFQTRVSNRQPWFSNWEAERARPAIIREHSNAFGKETLMRQWQSLQGWQVAEHAISKGQAVPCWGELLNFWETRFRKIFVNFIALVIETKWLFCYLQSPQAQCIISPESLQTHIIHFPISLRFRWDF